ncbi:CPBP family intramembrane glutamic endopeptidase [Paenibacillus mucilaginosus]|nr:type II CAAX endopeptidase family protein [Paenibacillus mucilaginosus]
MNLNQDRSAYLMACLFVGAVIGVQVLPLGYTAAGAAGLLLLSLFRPHASYRGAAAATAAYMAGYVIYTCLVPLFHALPGDREAVISLSRLSLIGFLVPFYFANRMDPPRVNYLKRGSFRETIYFPFIFSGFLRDPIWRFLLIFAAVTLTAFVWAMDWKQENLGRMLLYALLFAVINAPLEEVLWRGYVLSRFTDRLGETRGLLAMALGFGFYHYSLGFPWSICALFSFFGLLMGGVAVRSRGLLPVILLHFWMNVLFVLGGIVF